MGRQRVIHGYDMKRPGQSRGVPWLAPVMHVFKDLSEYVEAELVAARVAACFALLLTDTNPIARSAWDKSGDNEVGQQLFDMEPGMVRYVGEGKSVSSFTPNRPTTAFDAFVERLLRQIAAALGLPYELVAKDFSKVNYSSARAALLEARRMFRMHQARVSSTFCQPVWEWFLEELWIKGLWAQGYDFYALRPALTVARWIAPGWEWVDPMKEVNASVTAVKENQSSLADELAARGRDLDETLEQRARETRALRATGLVDQVTESEVDTALVEMGLELPVSDAYLRFGRKPPQEGEKTLKAPAVAGGVGSTKSQAPNSKQIPNSNDRNGGDDEGDKESDE
jgi:lambda family phage portal protein